MNSGGARPVNPDGPMKVRARQAERDGYKRTQYTDLEQESHLPRRSCVFSI